MYLSSATSNKNHKTQAIQAADCVESAPKGVKFGEVRVRQHERIVNKRPSSIYCDLSLGWAHSSSHRQMLDEFEKLKQNKEDSNGIQRHNATERMRVLNEYGYKMKDVLKTEKEKKKPMEQRNAVVKELKQRRPRSKSPVTRLLKGIGLRKKEKEVETNLNIQ